MHAPVLFAASFFRKQNAYEAPKQLLMPNTCTQPSVISEHKHKCSESSSTA